MTEFKEVTAGQSKEMPAKTVCYGMPKVGKTTFCSQFPDPFFIDIEGGLEYLGKKVRATPKLSSFEDVMAWMKHIYESDFKSGTLIIDSLDWVESLSQAKLIKDNNATSITDPAVKAFAYHKGVVDAANEVIKILRWCDAIYKKKGIKTVLIAHSQVKEVDMPGFEPYQRNEMKLSKQLAAKVYEWADLVLFAAYSFHVTSEGKTSEPKPVLFAGGSAAFVGGGRMKLAKELPLDYKLLEKEITK